jgi:hypothetical protein
VELGELMGEDDDQPKKNRALSVEQLQILLAQPETKKEAIIGVRGFCLFLSVGQAPC